MTALDALLATVLALLCLWSAYGAVLLVRGDVDRAIASKQRRLEAFLNYPEGWEASDAMFAEAVLLAATVSIPCPALVWDETDLGTPMLRHPVKCKTCRGSGQIRKVRDG